MKMRIGHAPRQFCEAQPSVKFKALPRTRPPLERMKLIYDALMAGRYPNSCNLAIELETSPQTVKRDIEFMRDRWHLPIVYDTRRHGYYFSGPVEFFPGLPVRRNELLALTLAHKALEPYASQPVQKSLASSVERCTRNLEPVEQAMIETLRRAVSFRSLTHEPIDLSAFDVVTRAMAGRRALIFDYRKPGETVAGKRHVYPYHLTAFEQRWYLLALDVTRGEIRKFGLNRMRNLQILDREGFPPPTDFDPEQYLAGSFGLMTGEADYEVTIEVDAWLTDVLRGRRWLRKQVWTELPGGGSRLQLRLNCLEEIEHWVMSWSSHVKVLEPTALVERVIAAARHVLTRHTGRELAQPSLAFREKSAANDSTSLYLFRAPDR